MAQVDNAKNYARISYSYPLPPLIEVQLESFKRLKPCLIRVIYYYYFTARGQAWESGSQFQLSESALS